MKLNQAITYRAVQRSLTKDLGAVMKRVEFLFGPRRQDRPERYRDLHQHCSLVIDALEEASKSEGQEGPEDKKVAKKDIARTFLGELTGALFIALEIFDDDGTHDDDMQFESDHAELYSSHENNIVEDLLDIDKDEDEILATQYGQKLSRRLRFLAEYMTKIIVSEASDFESSDPSFITGVHTLEKPISGFDKLDIKIFEELENIKTLLEGVDWQARRKQGEDPITSKRVESIIGLIETLKPLRPEIVKIQKRPSNGEKPVWVSAIEYEKDLKREVEVPDHISEEENKRRDRSRVLVRALFDLRMEVNDLLTDLDEDAESIEQVSVLRLFHKYLATNKESDFYIPMGYYDDIANLVDFLEEVYSDLESNIIYSQDILNGLIEDTIGEDSDIDLVL